MTTQKFSIVVATDEKRGIGKDNKIPWHIKEDLLNLKKLTQSQVVIVGANTYISMQDYSEKRFNELNSYCVQHPNVIYTDELIGGADFEIECFMRNSIELQEFMNEMRYKFNDIIRDFEIMLYYKEHKLVLFPWEG